MPNQYLRMWAAKCYGYVLVKTGYFYGIIHSINVVLLVLLTGISGHNCNRLANLFKTIVSWYIKLSINQLMIIYCGKPSTIWLVVSTILKNMKVSWEGLSHILWKNKIYVWTTNQIHIIIYQLMIIYCGKPSIIVKAFPFAPPVRSAVAKECHRFFQVTSEMKKFDRSSAVPWCPKICVKP